MTIRKKLFWTNTFMVLLAMLVLLGIGGSMICLFKDEFLRWYGSHSQLADRYTEVYAGFPEVLESDSWDGMAEQLTDYGFPLIVIDEDRNFVYNNAKHSEEEGTEALFYTPNDAGKITTYLVESTTVLATRVTVDDNFYDIYAVNCPSELSFRGMDRGMFEMFIVVFLVVGILAIGGILLLSQIFSRRLIRHILSPAEALDVAAKRVMDGELTTPIGYPYEDEFKGVCDSFDLMQEHLREEMEKNAAYEKARTEMVSGISHDLRTPLTSIKGYVKGMLDGIANTEEKRTEYLKIAYRKSCDMDVLLSKLFYFSMLETGNMPFFFRECDVERFLRDYVEEKEPEFTERRIAAEVVSDLKAPVYGSLDTEQMIRVFDNLMENACKYANRPDDLRISIHIAENDGWIVVDFGDNGDGMEQEKLGAVFDEFYRGDESRSSGCDGNGLGLYVCRYIIKEHGGKIRAYTKDGFHVEMCLPEAAEHEKEKAMPEEGRE